MEISSSNQVIIYIIILIISIYFLSINLMDFNIYYTIQNSLSLGLFTLSVFMIGCYFGLSERS